MSIILQEINYRQAVRLLFRSIKTDKLQQSKKTTSQKGEAVFDFLNRQATNASKLK